MDRLGNCGLAIGAQRHLSTSYWQLGSAAYCLLRARGVTFLCFFCLPTHSSDIERRRLDEFYPASDKLCPMSYPLELSWKPVTSRKRFYIAHHIATCYKKYSKYMIDDQISLDDIFTLLCLYMLYNK